MMRSWLPTLLALFVAIVLATPADAVADGDYTCKGERIERGGSTWGYARTSGSDYRIEKGSSSVGWAKSRNSNWAIETFGGSTLGWLKDARIEKPNNASWATLAEAQKFAKDCPAPVAAAMWVLSQSGKL